MQNLSSYPLGHLDGALAPDRDDGAEQRMGGRLLRVVLDGRIEVLELVIAELLEQRAERLQ